MHRNGVHCGLSVVTNNLSVTELNTEATHGRASRRNRLFMRAMWHMKMVEFPTVSALTRKSAAEISF